MMTSREWKKSAGFWTGFEEVPDRPGTCIIRTHPLSRLIAETVMLILLWSCWAVIFDNSLKHSSNVNTFFGGVFGFVTDPVIVWGIGALLVVASIMASPQTLIVEADAPLFTYIIGFEHFGIRFVRPRTVIRGLLLVTKTYKGASTTYTYVAWNGLGLPAMFAGCNDYQATLDHANDISAMTGLVVLGASIRAKEQMLKRLRTDGCFACLFSMDILSVWHSEGTVDPAYLTHVARHPSAALFFLGMSLVFFPLATFDFVWTAFKLNRLKRQPDSLEDGRSVSTQAN